MDLHTHQPYSLLKYGLLNNYPSLQKNTTTDVAIMGCGITGALVAWHLAQQGIHCIAVDKRHVGTGSTAASTSLIQYEIDTPLHVLANKIGFTNALAAYQLCRKAIDDLENIDKATGSKSNFKRTCSFQFASYKKDVKDLYREYEARKNAGFDVAWLEEHEVFKKFGMHKPAGILSNEAAQVNAYLLTDALLQSVKKYCAVYDHTEITNIAHEKNKVLLTTKDGFTIEAKKLVIACGYESQKYIDQKVEQLHTTYAIISEPLSQNFLWHRNCLIWETAKPYLYLRTTTDNRILIGGKDTDYYIEAKQQQMVSVKARALQKAFHKLLPQLPFKIDFKWAGAFASTKDGLPYIGMLPTRRHTYFALGFGGNGITFSVLAAQLITQNILGNPGDNAHLFAFDR